MNEPDPDAALVEGIARGDADAAREMVARKLPRLLSLATRFLGDQHEAQDVAQETFLRVWSEAPRWRPGEARFDTWLHRVALNLCYDRLRKHRRQDPRSLDELPAGVVDATEDHLAAPQEMRMIERETQDDVKAAIAALPSRQREALLLQYYQDLGNVDAAAVLGISVDALESLLSRARRTLRNELKSSSSSQGPVTKVERK